MKKKDEIKVKSKKLTVAAPAAPAKKKRIASDSANKPKHIDDETFEKGYKKFMKKHENLLKNLSKR